MKRLHVYVLAAYCFVVHFGNLFRFSSAETALGVSTLLGLLLAFSAFNRVPQQISKTPMFKMFAILFVWAFFSSAMSPSGVITAYKSLGILILYLFMSASVSTWEFEKKDLSLVAKFLAAGLLLSGGLTLIDYLGWVNVPYCNQVVSGSHIGSDTSGSYVMQAGGFFPRRSAMAAVFSLSIAASVVIAISEKSWLAKAFYSVSALTGILSVMLTHNRSSVLAIGLALVGYVLLNNTFSMSRRVKIAALAGGFSVVAIVLALIYFPAHVEVYKKKIASLLGGSEHTMTSSDHVRVEMLQNTLKSMASNPMGHGFGPVHSVSGRFAGKFTDPHNLLTSWLWAVGAFAFLWLVLFLRTAFLTVIRAVEMRPELVPYYDAGRVALMAWFFHNMAHNSFGTGLAWLLLGIVISLRQRAKSELQYYQWQQNYYRTAQFGYSP